MMKRRTCNTPSKANKHGAALVVTLIVCTVLAMVVVAMMQNTTLDRSSSKSIASHYRAQLAAEAGLAVASSTLATNATNDTFIVVANTSVSTVTNGSGGVTTNTNTRLFIGNGVTNSTNFSYAPLFSAVTNATNIASNVVTGGLPTLVPQGLTTNYTNWVLPGGISITSPVVSWTYMTSVQTNATGQTNVVTNARFAYWVEDLSGKLDLSVVGTDDLAIGRRPTGTNPAEIALWSIFNPGVVSDVTNVIATNLVAARSRLLTTATSRLVNSNVPTNRLSDLAVNLRHDTNEPQLIPFGFGYTNQGAAKFDLNINTNAASLVNLVAAITNNLRSPTDAAVGFGTATRSGGMNGERYVHAIAASMIDYVDADNVPTTGTAGGGAFRGIEGLPFVTETATAIQWVNHATNIPGFGEVWADEIHVENYVELWNPTDKAFSGTLDVAFLNDYACGSVNGFPIDLRITNSTVNSTVTNTLSFSNNNYQIMVATPLEPNEYRVYSLGTNIFRFRVANSGATAADPLYGGKKASGGGNLRLGRPSDGTTDSFGSSLTASFGGVVYDRIASIHRVGNRTLYCRPFSAGNNALPDWAGNVPALRMHPTESLALPGDPRMGFYLTSTNNAQGYATTGNPGSSMGFRNRGTSSGNTIYNTEPSRWLDAGYTNTPANNPAPNDGVRPLTNRQTTAHANDFVQRLNNTGSWTNILELGNVFDPAAWTMPTNTPHILSTHVAAGNGTTSVTFGGGNTLRIGRVEHPRFTNVGLRASQLLDIFAVGPKVGVNVVNRVPGRINLNTASTNVLRALAAGGRHSVEPSMRPINLDVPVAAVSAFVTGVTNFRSQRPFYSTSQLNLLSTDTSAGTWVTGAVFGRTNLLGVTAWGDRAAEEWFSRIYHLSTVRSRNFLVHIVGQTLQTNNPTEVLGTSRRMFQVYVDPVRGPDGLTTGATVRILGQWEL